MFINNYKKGFTIGEVLVSAVALTITSLAFQSLYLTTKNFYAQSQSHFQDLIKESGSDFSICSEFQFPVLSNINKGLSFEYDPDPSAPFENDFSKTGSAKMYTRIGDLGIDLGKATLGVPLGGCSTGSCGSSSDIFFASKIITELNSESPPYDQGQIQTVGDGSSYSLSCTVGSTLKRLIGTYTKNKFYKIFSDSHTLITYETNKPSDIGSESSSANEVGSIQGGRIFAARCMERIKKNSPTTVPEQKYGTIASAIDGITVDSNVKISTAVQILESAYRPFYNPTESKDADKIKCCDVRRDDSSSCEGIDGSTKYIPALYVIHFKNYNTKAAIDRHSDDDCKLTDVPEGFEDRMLEDSSSAWMAKHHGSEWCECINNIFSSTCVPGDDLKYRHAKFTCKQNKYMEQFDFDVMVEFDNIIEFPLDSHQTVSKFFGLSFIAPRLKGSDGSIMLSMLNMSNECSVFNLKTNCPSVVPGVTDLSTVQIQHSTGSSPVTDYFKLHSKQCSFRYISVDNSGEVVPMGIGWE